jgi:acyl-CoA thioester hydrolase
VTIPRTAPPSDAATIEGEVPFHDVDPLHIVWHGHYYKYVEIARTALFRRHGIDGLDLLRLGFRFVVAHSECRHVSALRYGDKYRVRAWFIDSEQRVNVGYEVWNLTADRRAARARTALVTTDADGEMLLETPKVIRDRIATPLQPSDSRA